MTAIDNVRKRLRGVPAFALAFSVTGVAAAAPCADLNPVNPIYGAGGSAVTATLAAIATALVSLPEEDRVTIFYNDPGACTGYNSFVAGASTNLTYKYWNSAGVQGTCEAPASATTFAHMGNTPLLCPGNQPLPAGFAKFVAPVQTINLITHEDSTEDSISAEALYHVYGFGPGASGRSVEPWLVPNGVFGRRTSSFVHQILAGAIGVPATGFKIPSASPNNFLDENIPTVVAVGNWGNTNGANQPLGYVSGSAAELGETDAAYSVKTLAYQHFDQTCAYLPDTSRTKRDRLNARTGQYYLWTPAWLYARVNGAGEVESEITKKFIGWFDGTIESPDGVDIQEIIIESGDIPLCAMQAIRPEGDLSPIQSYAPDQPCNGYYEFVKTGDTDYTACDSNDECAGFDDKTGTTEICSFGFCELTYGQSN